MQIYKYITHIHIQYRRMLDTVGYDISHRCLVRCVIYIHANMLFDVNDEINHRVRNLSEVISNTKEGNFSVCVCIKFLKSLCWQDR